MRASRTILLATGGLLLVLLGWHFGLARIAEALARITGWQLGLICLLFGASMVFDTLGWRCTLVGRRPPFTRLFATRCAGQAVNAVTAAGGLGGEPVKAWLLRRDLAYEASVSSLIVAKTAEVTGQTLLLLAGILVAWTTGIAGPALLGPMCSLLLIEVIGVGGFVLVQMAGGIGRAGRLVTWIGAGGARLDGAVRSFYRAHWRSFLLSVAFHFAGWLVGVVEAFWVLRSLDLPVTPAAAMTIESLGTAVRFATFVVPASLGTLEGANAAAFAAIGWAGSDGLAFSLVRRGRQAVWIVIGLAVLLVAGAPRSAPRQAAMRAVTRAD